LDPSIHHGIGADNFNEVVDEAGARFPNVLIEAVKLRRRLLPEVYSDFVCAVAQQLWEDAT
jgi:hypothetical protein